MTSNASDIVYQFRVFLPRGETYAIRLSGPEVTGLCGPLEYHEMTFSALPSFDYAEGPDAVEWVKANFSEFVLCQAECDEAAIWI